MMDLYFIFQFVKVRCRGNQIMLSKWRQTDTTCILYTFARCQHGFVLLRLATNATISCKILVKFSPVVLAENILIKIALCVHVVVRRISSNISGYTGPIFAIFSPYECTICYPHRQLSPHTRRPRSGCDGLSQFKQHTGKHSVPAGVFNLIACRNLTWHVGRGGRQFHALPN